MHREGVSAVGRSFNPDTYRCTGCGLALRAPRSRCPRCGRDLLRDADVIGGALHYGLADRSRGPAVEDGRLGCLAYLYDWMSLAQVSACIEAQRAAARSGRIVPRFGDIAVAQGSLTPPQVRALLRLLAIRRPCPEDRRFGALAVEKAYLTPSELDEALREQEALLREHHEAPCLGILLVEKGFLDISQVKEIAEEQRRSRGRRDAARPEPPGT